MSTNKPPGESLYRGPSKAPRDKRERERDRARQQDAPDRAPQGEPSRADAVQRARHETPRPSREPLGEPQRDAAPRPPQEQRYYGLNACLALFAHRPQDVRKVWLLESRIPALKAVLAHCVKHRLGYTIVESEDLERLSGSAHHEGVVFGAMPAPELSLSGWLGLHTALDPRTRN